MIRFFLFGVGLLLPLATLVVLLFRRGRMTKRTFKLGAVSQQWLLVHRGEDW